MKTNCSQNRELNQISSATYNVQQLAQFLNISRDTIYRMRDSGELPPTIPMQRRIVRWQVKDIELWFEFGCPTEKSFVRLKKDMLRFTRQN